jgi:predicted RNA binding protein YcfA (HicA-like mRNA interferase family)
MPIEAADTYFCRMKVREVIALIEKDGWYQVRTKGDHRQYKHPVKSGRVTIAGNTGRDMPAGTLNSVLKQAGLKGAG